MLWNGNLAYLYMPRTASKSLNSHFSKHWVGPLFGTASPAHLLEINRSSKIPTFVTKRKGHENMSGLIDQLYRHGRSIKQMKKIVFVVRNPYKLVYSNYMFLVDQARKGSENPNAILALNSSFDDFCKSINHPNPANWMLIDGRIPKNLHILSFESLQHDVDGFMKQMGMESGELPHLNKNSYGIFSMPSIRDESEGIIYNSYRMMFDCGGYDRHEGL